MPLEQTWRSELTLSSEAATARERQRLARLASTGELTRVARGVYRSPRDLDPARQHLESVRAVTAVNRADVVAFRSAAAVWSLPRLDPWPERVDVVVPATRALRSTARLRRHVTDLPFETVEIGGVTVTSLVRTAIDVARIDGTASAVASVDAALAGVWFGDSELRPDRDALLGGLGAMGTRRGTASARFVIDFADGLAESPGESLSRLQMHRLGLSAPELQHRFVDDEGSMFADFFWPEFGVVGEFDGAAKYLIDPDPSAVRAALLREKRREDRLRAQVRRVVRWDWAVARDRVRLGAGLRAAGVR